MNAKQFRDILTSYLTEPEYADVVAIKANDRVCMGVTLEDGSRMFVTIEKMSGDSFPGTHTDLAPTETENADGPHG